MAASAAVIGGTAAVAPIGGTGGGTAAMAAPATAPMAAPATITGGGTVGGGAGLAGPGDGTPAVAAHVADLPMWGGKLYFTAPEGDYVCAAQFVSRTSS